MITLNNREVIKPMKRVKITFTGAVFDQLKEAMTWDGRERAAFLLCHSTTDGHRIKLMPHTVLVPEEEDYNSRSGGHYSLSPPFVEKAVNLAVETQSDLIQGHIHPSGYPGEFSPVDAAEEPKLMAHVADKVNNIMHASLVFGNDLKSLDSWFYDRERDQLIPVEKVLVVGPEKLQVYVPPRSDVQGDQLQPIQVRTAQAFGPEWVRLMGLLDFAVVGVSGLGGLQVEILTREGANSITLCDPDNIDGTNRNRLPYTTSRDEGKPKVDFYGDLAIRIDPDMEVRRFRTSLYDPQAQKAVAQADIVFGCVDSEARLSLNRLACANLIPYFDLGATIQVENGETTFVGGQVYSVIPGREVCLSCSGVFDTLKSRFLSPEEQDRERRQGYLQGQDTDDPQVMSLDMALVSQAYALMRGYLLGQKNGSFFKVHYNEQGPKLTPVRSEPIGCFTCRPDGYLGRGDMVPALVPREKEEFKPPELPTNGQMDQVEDQELDTGGDQCPKAEEDPSPSIGQESEDEIMEGEDTRVVSPTPFPPCCI